MNNYVLALYNKIINTARSIQGNIPGNERRNRDMNKLEQDHPITRTRVRWKYGGSYYWFRKNAEKARADFKIYTLAPKSHAYHLKKGTKGYDTY